MLTQIFLKLTKSKLSGDGYSIISTGAMRAMRAMVRLLLLDLLTVNTQWALISLTG